MMVSVVWLVCVVGEPGPLAHPNNIVTKIKGKTFRNIFQVFKAQS
jgi:hypothetical protein